LGEGGIDTVRLGNTVATAKERRDEQAEYHPMAHMKFSESNVDMFTEKFGDTLPKYVDQRYTPGTKKRVPRQKHQNKKKVKRIQTANKEKAHRTKATESKQQSTQTNESSSTASSEWVNKPRASKLAPSLKVLSNGAMESLRRASATMKAAHIPLIKPHHSNSLNVAYGVERKAAAQIGDVVRQTSAEVKVARHALKEAQTVARDTGRTGSVFHEEKGAHELGETKLEQALANMMSRARTFAKFDAKNAEVKHDLSRLKSEQSTQGREMEALSAMRHAALDSVEVQKRNIKTAQVIGQKARILQKNVHERLGEESDLGESQTISSQKEQIKCSKLKSKKEQVQCFKQLGQASLSKAADIARGETRSEKTSEDIVNSALQKEYTLEKANDANEVKKRKKAMRLAKTAKAKDTKKAKKRKKAMQAKKAKAADSKKARTQKKPKRVKKLNHAKQGGKKVAAKSAKKLTKRKKQKVLMKKSKSKAAKSGQKAKKVKAVETRGNAAASAKRPKTKVEKKVLSVKKADQPVKKQTVKLKHEHEKEKDMAKKLDSLGLKNKSVVKSERKVRAEEKRAETLAEKVEKKTSTISLLSEAQGAPFVGTKEEEAAWLKKQLDDVNRSVAASKHVKAEMSKRQDKIQAKLNKSMKTASSIPELKHYDNPREASHLKPMEIPPPHKDQHDGETVGNKFDVHRDDVAMMQKAHRIEHKLSKEYSDALTHLKTIEATNDVTKSTFKNVDTSARDVNACFPVPSCLKEKFPKCVNTYDEVNCIRARRGKQNLCKMSATIQEKCCAMCSLTSTALCEKERLILAAYVDGDKPKKSPKHEDGECMEWAAAEDGKNDPNIKKIAPSFMPSLTTKIPVKRAAMKPMDLPSA